MGSYILYSICCVYKSYDSKNQEIKIKLIWIVGYLKMFTGNFVIFYTTYYERIVLFVW